MNYIGIDIIEAARIEQALIKQGERFLNRVYTTRELESYRKYLPSLAARFAGKEAVMKAIGLGIGWKEIEILSDPDGKPVIHLHGKARERARNLKLDNIMITISHAKEYAIAMVIGETN